MVASLRPFLFRLVSITVFALAVAAPPATAQDAQPPALMFKEVTPIEVALMYKKLLKQEPDFAALLSLSPDFKNDPSRFGNAVLLQLQQKRLKEIYDGLTPDTVFMVKKRLSLQAIDIDKRTFKIVNLTPDEPFSFAFDQAEPYGIFLRNADAVSTVAPPFEFDDFFWLNGSVNLTYPAEIVVKPVAADTNSFPLADGKTVKPLIADVVELTVLATNGNKIIVQKRFNNWKPGTTSSLLELKDNPIENAAPALSSPSSPSTSAPLR